MATESGKVTKFQPPTLVHDVTPNALLQLAVQQGADIGKLEQLMALQERWEANEARKAFVVAMASFKADPPTIRKNKHVAFGTTRYDHATLDEVTGKIAAGLARHGLSHSWSVAQADGAITVRCTITHVLGHSESVTMTSGADTSGQKNAIQAIGSAVTYLQRYTLLAATGLSTSDMVDDDGKNATGASQQGEGVVPEGFDTWWAELQGAALKGAKALEAVWSRPNKALRIHVAHHHAMAWEILKTDAAQVGK